MSRPALLYAAIAVSAAVRPGGCGNECDFFERCQGDVRQICGGVDQCLGRRVREEPCSTPNDVCVAVGQRAECVHAPLTRCAESFVSSCDGFLLLRCTGSSAGYVVAMDCSATGERCEAGPDGAACVR